jgi:hypothetical protein
MTTLDMQWRDAAETKYDDRGHDDDDDSKDLSLDERRQRDEIAPYLLMRAYHLPGNSWWQDWWQYQTNNHPLFGVCLHHKYHPLSWKIRAISLAGSMLFGLALTNMIYLAFVFANQDETYEATWLDLETNLTKTGLSSGLDQTVSSISVTTGNLILWTVGALIHGFYDNIIWALAACTCCTFEGGDDKVMDAREKERRMRRYRSTGTFFVVISVVLVTAICSFVVLLRAGLEAESEMEANYLNFTTTGTGRNPNILEAPMQVHDQFESVYYDSDFSHYNFVISYMVELSLSYVIFYPITGTILFSGCLSCGKCPLTGGRPYELTRMELLQQEREEGVEIEWKQSDTEEDKDIVVEASSNTAIDEEEDVNGECIVKARPAAVRASF